MIKKIKSYLRKIINAAGRHYHLYPSSRVVYNVNYNPLKQQKKVAFVMLSARHDIQEGKLLAHPSVKQYYLIVRSLIKKDFAIDLYHCTADYNPYNMLVAQDGDVSYDYIIGFGATYLKLCQLFPKAIKVLFITENAPWVVRKNYQERLDYYVVRHGTLIPSNTRMGYYSDEMYMVSDAGLAMTGSYNIDGMKAILKRIVHVPVNALITEEKRIVKKDFDNASKRFVWFGSNGMIHKGLDILVDVFKEMPDYTLDIYGANPDEICGIQLPHNVINRGFVYFDSEEMWTEVAGKHAWVISISCSEGMMSGIATCMSFGLIPVVTKENGYDDCPYCLMLDDWHVDYVKQKILELSSMPMEKLQSLSETVSEYARTHYTDIEFQRKVDVFLDDLEDGKIGNS